MVLHKDRHIERQNRIKTPEINSCIYRQLVFGKGAKTTYWTASSVNGVGIIGASYVKNETRLLPYNIH